MFEYFSFICIINKHETKLDFAAKFISLRMYHGKCHLAHAAAIGNSMQCTDEFMDGDIGCEIIRNMKQQRTNDE